MPSVFVKNYVFISFSSVSSVPSVFVKITYLFLFHPFHPRNPCSLKVTWSLFSFHDLTRLVVLPYDTYTLLCGIRGAAALQVEDGFIIHHLSFLI